MVAAAKVPLQQVTSTAGNRMKPLKAKHHEDSCFDQRLATMKAMAML